MKYIEWIQKIGIGSSSIQYSRKKLLSTKVSGARLWMSCLYYITNSKLKIIIAIWCPQGCLYEMIINWTLKSYEMQNNCTTAPATQWLYESLRNINKHTVPASFYHATHKLLCHQSPLCPVHPGILHLVTLLTVPVLCQVPEKQIKVSHSCFSQILFPGHFRYTRTTRLPSFLIAPSLVTP